MAAQDPTTLDEWQGAVNGAQGALCLDSARQYGLAKGGPEIDRERCLEILELGRAIGVIPVPSASKDFVEAWNAFAAMLKRKQAVVLGDSLAGDSGS